MASRAASPRARLAGAGLDPDRALAELEAGGLLEDGQLPTRLLTSVSEAADPPSALACVAAIAQNRPSHYAEVAADPGWLERVVQVAGASRPLGDLLARHTEALEGLRTLEPLDRDAMIEAVRAAVERHTEPLEQSAAIAAERRRATAHLAARDLTGAAEVERVAAELADLAEAVLTGTLAGVHAQLAGDTPAARIGVIGMGKLGGHELNYVSDVDVVFVHEPTDGTSQQDAAQEARVVLTRLLELLNTSTTMGRTYEIDPSLRPEGRSGPLSRTIASFEAYWERWAKTWEFQALIKARPVAGDLQLGAELLERAEPYVWPEDLDADTVAEIREMKSRIEAKPEVVRHGDRQLKLGPGGIRDIEFAVQLLQLVHGRGDPTLRLTGTLPALRALVHNGYVDEHDGRAFADAYRTLRSVEHRLQLANERRTHTIPDDPDRQEQLARALGLRAEGDRSAWELLERQLSAVQAEVRELHAKLFYRPLLETYLDVPVQTVEVSVPGATGLSDAAATERLEALGFQNGAAALEHVRALTSGLTRRARVVRAVLPGVLEVLQDTPDPDTGLGSFRELVEAHGQDAQLLGYLRDHPDAAQLLGRVLGTSRVAGELLIGQPKGVAWLRDRQLRDEPRTRDELVRRAVGRLHWQDTTAALRRFKRLELLRMVLRDLSGATTVGSLGQELAALGEACLAGALEAQLRERARAEGLQTPDELPVSIGIIGMGKLGGQELHYVSDLDVMFVHEPRDGVDPRRATKLALEIATAVMRSLSDITAEGTAFEVDADLRPEGRNGPLSRTLGSYRAYYERWAQPWERQALIKARTVAGDEELGSELVALTREHAYGVHPEDIGEMRRMKARLEKERIPRRIDPRHHLKLGPGGLSDVEWTIQLLQRQHGATQRAVRTPSTMGALDALQDQGLIDSRDTAWLRDGYRFLSELRNRLYLLRHRDVDVLPASTPQLETLARSMEYGRGGWQDLDEDRRRHMRHVRQVCERLFYDIRPAMRS